MSVYQGYNTAPATLPSGYAPRLFVPAQCLVLGLSVFLPIFPEARLTLFDIVAAAIVLYHWQAVQGQFKGAAICLGISLLAMSASAYVNGSELRALVSRSYSMIALLLEIAAYWIIFSKADDRARALLVLGAMIGICCHYFYPADPRILDSPIKFLIGIPLGVGLLALYAYAIPRASASIVLVAALMAAYALFCFLVGSRSIGGVYFASAILVAVIGFARVPMNYASLAPFLIVATAVVGYAFTELYTALAIHGYFGDRAAGIAIFQSSFGSIILGGRPEIIINLAGIRDSPVFGVGIGNYSSVYIYEMINLLVYSSSDVIDTENVLYHSALFATAFESGIFSAALWLYLLYRTLFCIPLLSRMGVAARAFSAPAMLITAWHILYSPPIPYNRFVMAMGLGICFYIYNDWKQRRGTNHPAALLPRDP